MKSSLVKLNHVSTLSGKGQFEISHLLEENASVTSELITPANKYIKHDRRFQVISAFHRSSLTCLIAGVII